ncbi:DNA methylation [Streptococcus phage Javan405]|nr:DNA methylation [Streptococcus phage Javan405]
MTTSQALTQHNFQKQISGVREALVKMCLSQESEQAYTVSEVDSFLHLLTSSKAKRKKINPSGYSLKMLRDFYQVAGDEIISTISLSWMKQGTTLSGKCSIQKTTEFPKIENASTLSDILEAEVDEKYYLSAEKAVAILSNL